MFFSLNRSKAYCINLDSDTESWERADRQFKAQGINVIRFPAVDGKNLVVPDVCPNSGEIVSLSRGGYGCFLSHLEIIKLAKAEDLDYVIIFEDDVELCDDFKERLIYLEFCKVDFDLFYFGAEFNEYTKDLKDTGKQYIFNYQGAGGTHAYVICRYIYDYILKNVRFDRAIDGFYSTLVGNQPDDRISKERRFSVKGFFPLAACQTERVSSDSGLTRTIDGSNFRKHPLFKLKGKGKAKTLIQVEKMNIVGFQSGHDVSYCILENGIPILHEELERFSRKKMEIGDGLKFFMSRVGNPEMIAHFAFGNYAGRSGRWKELCGDQESEDRMRSIIHENDGQFFDELSHHDCHAANAFFSSDFDRSLIVTVDGGGGEKAEDGQPVAYAFAVYDGKDNRIERVDVKSMSEVNLGGLWHTSTNGIFGLSVGYPKGDQSGTVMAMATLGNPKYIDLIAGAYEQTLKGGEHTNYMILRQIANQSEQDAFDVAASLQKYTETTFHNLLRQYVEGTDYENICFSGGVSLNCVMLGKIKSWFPQIKNVFCDPVPYDAGLAIGSARYVWHQILGNPRIKNVPQNRSPYLGVAYTLDMIKSACVDYSGKIETLLVQDTEVLRLIESQKIVSVFGGGSESGRRALGCRSILADPRNNDMKSIINNKVKHRQWFRPFAPSILLEKVSDWFEESYESPYMSFAVKFKEEVRDKVPAVVHYDGTGRLQTVDKSLNPWYHNFISQWEQMTGVPILLNTSFNDTEPIVETPADAIRCFLKTEIDFLYFYDHGILLRKT